MNEFFAIKLNKKNSTPVYKQLGDGLSTLIEQGILKPHSKLPPIRKMSNALKVNNVTIVNAYKYLENKKIVYSLIGSGTYVFDNSVDKKYNTLQISDEINTYSNKKYIDFSGNYSNSNIFPIEDYKFYMGKTLEKYGGEAFNDVIFEGFFYLRNEICKYLISYNINSNSENIFVVNSNIIFMEMINRVLIKPEMSAIFENYQDYSFKSWFYHNNFKIYDAPKENDIPDITVLEKFIYNTKPVLYYATPHFQNPKGKSNNLNKMSQLLELAEKYDFYIVEDASLGDIYYNGIRPTSFKSMDINDRVIYIKIFSKTILSGQNIGFAILPNNILNKFKNYDLNYNWQNNGFFQRVLTYYINEPRFKQQEQKNRDFFYKKLIFTEEVLNKYLKDFVEYSSPEGGLYLWLNFRQKNISVKDFCRELMSKGVLVSSNHLLFPSMSNECFIRLGFSNIPEEDIVNGVLTMKDIFVRK